MNESHRARDTPRDHADGPGRRAVRNPVADQFEQQRRHGRPFRVVQPVGVAQALRRAGRGYQPARTVMIDQVVDDGARFGHGDRAVDDDRRLAEGMHGEQRRRRQHGLRIPLVAHHLVGHPQLLEQPKHTLRP
jgi:hypothetical protein